MSRLSPVRGGSALQSLLPTSTCSVGTECWDSHLSWFQYLMMAVPTVPTKRERETVPEISRAHDLALVPPKNCRDCRDCREWTVSLSGSVSYESLRRWSACLDCRGCWDRQGYSQCGPLRPPLRGRPDCGGSRRDDAVIGLIPGGRSTWMRARDAGRRCDICGVEPSILHVPIWSRGCFCPAHCPRREPGDAQKRGLDRVA
jgi:hypothetical protein